MFQRLGENKDLIIVAVAAFFIGFGAASFFGVNSKEEPTSLSEENTPLSPLPPLPPVPAIEQSGLKNPPPAQNSSAPSFVPGGTDSILVENQRAGSTVILRHAEFMQARWVVVREMKENRDMGNILGAGWFPAGTHEEIGVELLRGTMGGEEYYVVVFADEGGDKRFEHTVDKPLINASGNVIRATFTTVANPSS